MRRIPPAVTDRTKLPMDPILVALAIKPLRAGRA